MNIKLFRKLLIDKLTDYYGVEHTSRLTSIIDKCLEESE